MTAFCTACGDPVERDWENGQPVWRSLISGSTDCPRGGKHRVVPVMNGGLR